MIQLVVKILKSRFFVMPVIISSIIIVSVYVYFYVKKEVLIFPNDGSFSFDYYTDEVNGGNSQVRDFLVTDSLIKMDFYLKEGFSSPYVGISFFRVNQENIKAINKNRLSINIKGKSIEQIGVSIFTPFFSGKHNLKLDEVVFHTNTAISEQSKPYTIPIKQMVTPEWWKELHYIPRDIKLKPEMSNILHVNIGTAYTPNINQEMSLEIHSLKLTRDNKKLLFWLVLSQILFIITLYIINYIYHFFIKHSRITIFYEPLSIKDKNYKSQKCIDFINSNFQNNNLTLEQVTINTGISQRRITNLIHKEYNCNFKSYINRIRINEAKRLLIHSDLNVGEIAYEVGFNNQSHFNRVFKNELNINPLEFREKHKM